MFNRASIFRTHKKTQNNNKIHNIIRVPPHNCLNNCCLYATFIFEIQRFVIALNISGVSTLSAINLLFL